MVNIDLRSDEIVIRNNESAMLGNKGGELILTNYRIVLVKKTVFGNKIKEMIEIPLSSIKMYNGEPQVQLTGRRTMPELQVQHTNGIDSIRFVDKKETSKWLNEIHKAITGQNASSNSDKLGSMAIPGMETLGKGIKDSVGAFATGLGIKEAIVKEKRISTKCSTCGAPLTGIKGEKATCEYCGSTQVLR